MAFDKLAMQAGTAAASEMDPATAEAVSNLRHFSSVAMVILKWTSRQYTCFKELHHTKDGS